jgi:tRNA A37 threonylcarbamoyladenosine synthetase subunit TsaC/SUA5/YrdC
MTSDLATAPQVEGPHPSEQGDLGGHRFLGDVAAERRAAERLADGEMVGYGFGNFYALATRPDREAVRAANLRKGRPADQVGSVVTTSLRIPLVFDWDRLPAGLPRSRVLGLMDALFHLGPFGFRGPAADAIPDHLTQVDAGCRTTQVIAPGYDCPSDGFVGSCLRRTGGDVLFITSANRSHHLSGTGDEPAHYRGAELAAEFGGDADLMLLRHRDEEVARRRYPAHAPMSTSLIGFHRIAGRDEQGRIRLVLERHGSLPVEQVRRHIHPLGFDVVLGPRARTRLAQRTYGATS